MWILRNDFQFIAIGIICRKTHNRAGPQSIKDVPDVKVKKSYCDMCGAVVSKLPRHIRESCPVAKDLERRGEQQSRWACGIFYQSQIHFFLFWKVSSICVFNSWMYHFRKVTKKSRSTSSARRQESDAGEGRPEETPPTNYPVGGTRTNPKGESSFWKVRNCLNLLSIA